ncbi:MAG: hypothetical protein Q4C76_03460 [Bacillota bacterium]|nr:hypothetical protein [Bacillota bacterium]
MGILLALCILLGFQTALRNLSSDQGEESRRVLEESLRRAAAACYAAEGCYPPTLDYIQQHYGVQIDEERYLVHYDCFAQNLMPEISILEKVPYETNR